MVLIWDKVYGIWKNILFVDSCRVLNDHELECCCHGVNFFKTLYDSMKKWKNYNEVNCGNGYVRCKQLDELQLHLKSKKRISSSKLLYQKAFWSYVVGIIILVNHS